MIEVSIARLGEDEASPERFREQLWESKGLTIRVESTEVIGRTRGVVLDAADWSEYLVSH